MFGQSVVENNSLPRAKLEKATDTDEDGNYLMLPDDLIDAKDIANDIKEDLKQELKAQSIADAMSWGTVKEYETISLGRCFDFSPRKH